MNSYRSQLIALVLLVATLAVFWRVTDHSFVWDDSDHIKENPYLNPVTSSHVLSFWQRPYQQLYIPLTYTVWAAIGHFSRDESPRGLHPGLFHLANLFLHALDALMVFVILRRLVGNEWAAGAGALLFGVHPLQVEPVAWISGMKDTLSGLLSLIAIWFYLQNKRSHYVVGTLVFVLAMLAKPAAMVVPMVAGALDYWLLRRPLRHCVLLASGSIALTLPFILVTRVAQPDTEITFITPMWARPLVAADALAFYLYKLVFPVWLGPDYGRSPEWLLRQDWIYFTWILPSAVLVLVWFARERKPWLIASAGVFVAGILPVSGLVPFVFQNLSTVADRYLYLSMLGPALALAWFLADSRGKLVAALCILILALLGIRSAFQTQHWQNDITLFQHALRINPDSWLAHYNLGYTLARRGMVDDAIFHYREAVRINPDYPEAQNNLGIALALK